MNPPPIEGTLPLGGAYDLPPRGTLDLPDARELLVARSVPAAFHADGTVARDTLQAMLESAYTGPVPKGPTATDVVKVENQPVIWGGKVIPHFGHFLTESVSRLWPLLPGGELEGMPAVFVTPRDALYAEDWLHAFGTEIVELPESGAVRFASIHVPEPSLRHGAWIAPEFREIHLHARRGMEIEPAPDADLLWLSRARLDPNRTAHDESLLEWLLGERLTILTPERATLAEQVAALEGARAVAGVIGSAFHTLLMVENPPDCLYLCPPSDRGAYPAQHRLLTGTATFKLTLAVTARRRRARQGLSFPGGFRILIPEALRALADTVLPGLLEDPRLATFAHPDSQRPERAESELDAAVLRVLREPLLIEPRRRLAAMFEAEGLARCAREQLGLVADLSDEEAGRRASPR